MFKQNLYQTKFFMHEINNNFVNEINLNFRNSLK